MAMNLQKLMEIGPYQFDYFLIPNSQEKSMMRAREGPVWALSGWGKEREVSLFLFFLFAVMSSLSSWCFRRQMAGAKLARQQEQLYEHRKISINFSKYNPGNIFHPIAILNTLISNMDLSGLANAQKTDAGKEQQGDKVNITFQAPSGAFEAEVLMVLRYITLKRSIPSLVLSLPHLFPSFLLEKQSCMWRCLWLRSLRFPLLLL